MKINILNKYHTIIIFVFSLIFYLVNLELKYNFTSMLCFFLIATIGVSHGALDNLKGAKLLKILKIKKNYIFYVGYIFLASLIILLWILLPVITLILFLIIASFHFGKEDNVFGKKEKVEFLDFLLFLKGSLVVTAPLYFNTNETLKIFEVLSVNLVGINTKIILGAIILSLLSNFLITKNIKLSFLDSFSIILLNITFSPLIAFTIYFCFLHSVRHSFSLIYEINKRNFKKGLASFFKQALQLTLITCLIFIAAVYFLNIYYLLNTAILKVVFIGLASLTFPHILLEYLLEKNEKRS